MAGAVFGLSSFSFQSWADAFNPREPGWRTWALRRRAFTDKVLHYHWAKMADPRRSGKRAARIKPFL
ncbi:hypothetical protein OAE78_01045, partial [Akkermansiaceae bacterium]|nr:hypothetical protein [Akkermansiaceae bacterium]